MSLTIISVPTEVTMNERFTITLSTEQRPTEKKILTVVRTTELEDAEENPFDIPMHGPTKVTVDSNGKAKFQVWFTGQPALVEGRRWPIPFKLKRDTRTIAKATAQIDCVEK